MALPTLAEESSLRDETAQQQQQQQAIQTRIDEADDETRELLTRLRDAQSSSQRLERYNNQLSSTLDEQQQRIDRQQHALETLDDTRDALPDTLQGMLDRLRALVEADMPFRHEERMARLDGLERTLADTSVSEEKRMEQLLSVWRAELDYGRNMDSWRGRLTQGDQQRDVQFLRMGRVGFYYLTPDGEQGGVWKNRDRQWHALDGAQRNMVNRGIRIANDQRAPELLSLPLSIEMDNAPSEAASQGASS
ncbi:hypothetical protein GCM10010082_08660 [Kushneria pakistanensis]|uniref:DUF3450 domain-containing protein n=1 Tax=Kushneria pakistanensis TaxID=1508770 RepID=A0ABQ3FD82_9GAMM|nr:DUF3450 domain-containing protein [Kushneria pakistanensis]GHC19336.1 hypothetical protein GCM10010082_08660 [Kushneria pakistanensis]